MVLMDVTLTRIHLHSNVTLTPRDVTLTPGKCRIDQT